MTVTVWFFFFNVWWVFTKCWHLYILWTLYKIVVALLTTMKYNTKDDTIPTLLIFHRSEKWTWKNTDICFIITFCCSYATPHLRPTSDSQKAFRWLSCLLGLVQFREEFFFEAAFWVQGWSLSETYKCSYDSKRKCR